MRSITTMLEYLNELEIVTVFLGALSDSFYPILTQFNCVYGYSFMQQRNRIRLINGSTDPPADTSR